MAAVSVAAAATPAIQPAVTQAAMAEHMAVVPAAGKGKYLVVADQEELVAVVQ